MADERILRFNAPPGWPVPNLTWQEAYAGWRPPHGWRPDASAPHAPKRWKFWLPIEPWFSATLGAQHRQRRVLRNLALVGVALAAAGTVAELLTAAPAGAILLIVTVLVAMLTALLTLHGQVLQTRRKALLGIERDAPRRIEAHKRALYDDFLRKAFS
jgi:hypothetical protein